MSTAPRPKSDSLSAALLALQATPIVAERSTEGQVGTRKYNYSTLDDCWKACRKPLQQAGLVIQQTQGKDAQGDPILITELIHVTSNQRARTEVLIPREGNMQQQGSAITYARRYGLVTTVGILTGEDDDGAAAASVSPSPAKAQPASHNQDTASPGGALATPKQTNWLKGLLETKDTSDDPDHWARIAEKRDNKTLTKAEATEAIDSLLKRPEWNGDN